MSTNFKVPPNLLYFKKLTTKIGILQHGKLDKPDPTYGYSIDDNARALVVAYQIFEKHKDRSTLLLAEIYFDYLIRSKIKGGYFHNFADKNDKFLDEVGSETSTGRTIWALGYLASRKNINQEFAQKAKEILLDLPPVSDLNHIRSKAYSLIGYYYLKDKEKVKFLADNLIESYSQHNKKNWFEDHFEYANGILPLALFLAYLLTKKSDYLKIAEKSYLFLDNTTRKPDHACPISHAGWKIGSKNFETYDQQAIEATDMVLASLAGFLSTNNSFYKKSADDWFDWFTGNNIGKLNLINQKTGSCFDGITARGVNENNGAESVLCYLLAYNAMADIKTLC